MRSVFSETQTPNGVRIYHEPHELAEQRLHSAPAVGPRDRYSAAGGCDMGGLFGTHFGMHLLFAAGGLT